MSADPSKSLLKRFNSDAEVRRWILTIGASALLAAFWLYEYVDEGRLVVYLLHCIGYMFVAVASIFLFVRRKRFVLDPQIDDSAPKQNTHLWWMLLILCLGLGLRVWSFTWNKWLFGDVNLFALTSREFALNGSLRYPMAYGPVELIDWQTLSAPATQHPLLFPLMGGILAAVAGTNDTFSVLKILSELGGLALLVLVGLSRRQPGVHWPSLLILLLTAVSPLLVDFSANGSPYIFSALTVVAICILLAVFDYSMLISYGLAGILYGLGLQFHNVSILLVGAVVAVWWLHRRELRPEGVVVFVFVIVISLVPSIIWNLENTGSLFFSSSTSYVLLKLGIGSFSEFGVNEAFHYLYFIKGTLHTFVRELQLEIGPGGLWLFALGLFGLWKKDRHTGLALILPLMTYALPTLMWPVFKHRFLVAFVPIVLIIAAYGYTYFNKSQSRAFITLNRVALGATLAWSAAGYFDTQPTRYYEPEEEGFAIAGAEETTKLVGQFAELPNGTVLDPRGAALLGLYWHSFPLIVTIDGSASLDEFQRMREEHNIRYIWTDDVGTAFVHKWFPDATVIIQGDSQVIYELP